METKCLVFRFADVEVREREFSIAKAGKVLSVEPKAFRVLLFLLRAPHRLITKEELLDAVWTDCEVSENSLTRSIALLRRLLGDDTRNPRYIATVPTVGYRFLCDVHTEEDEFSEAARPEPAVFPVRTEDPSRTRDAKAEECMGVLPKVDGTTASRHWLYGLVAATLLLAVSASVLWYRPKDRNAGDHQPQAAAAPSKDLRIVPLTNLPGAVNYPSFSPDGEKIAFIWYGENPGKGDV